MIIDSINRLLIKDEVQIRYVNDFQLYMLDNDYDNEDYDHLYTSLSNTNTQYKINIEKLFDLILYLNTRLYHKISNNTVIYQHLPSSNTVKFSFDDYEYEHYRVENNFIYIIIVDGIIVKCKILVNYTDDNLYDKLDTIMDLFPDVFSLKQEEVYTYTSTYTSMKFID